MSLVNLVGPLINFKAIKADYLGANARQLQTVYNYQRVIINAVTEVINRMSKVENYRRSIEIKKQQVQALEASVVAATSLFQNPRGETRIDYLDVLTAQRDLWEARRVLIDTKREQLSAIVNTYQALGGGGYLFPIPIPPPLQSHHWWKHSSHSVANTAVGSGPEPPPTPAAAPGSGSGPLPAPTPAPPSGPGPFPTPAAASGPQSPPTPAAETDLEPLPRPAAERGPVPLPRPAAERGPEPLPTPMGGGKGSDTMPEGSIPM